MAMLLIAAGLLAGLQTDTRCVTYSNGVTNCQSQAPLQPPPQAAAPDMTGVFSLLMGSPEKRRAKKIGKLIAAGKCSEAREVALKAGDYVAAQYVNSNCRSAPAE